jgi:hypothetical protein
VNKKFGTVDDLFELEKIFGTEKSVGLLTLKLNTEYRVGVDFSARGSNHPPVKTRRLK